MSSILGFFQLQLIYIGTDGLSVIRIKSWTELRVLFR